MIPAHVSFLPSGFHLWYRRVNEVMEGEADPALMSPFNLQNIEAVTVKSTAFSAVAAHESNSLCLYQSSVLSLQCIVFRQGVSLAPKNIILHRRCKGTSFCLPHFLGN